MAKGATDQDPMERGEIPCPQEGSRETQLLREGWSRRFITAEPRLSEAVELYQSLGYEVHLEALIPNEGCVEECTACFGPGGIRHHTIYIRPRRDS